MEKEIIKIEAGVNYLSESKVLSSLPKNCLFDKGAIGCGGTTLAIRDQSPYVILAPYISLVENKYDQHSNLIPVYGGVSVRDLKREIGLSKGTPKIIGTYDSLPKIIEAVNPKDYKLLIDEYHLLFKQYCFRDKAVRGVLDHYDLFKEYSFMTGTPLEEEFILTELKHLPVIEAQWPNIITKTATSINCPRGVFNSIVELINNYLGGAYGVDNAYIFVNSVNMIRGLVKATELKYENCNVIYGKSNKTYVGMKRGKLPSKADGSIKPKKINLITSTMFEGSDIYDENGRIYIASDGNLENTLVDISTSFQQIMGRIRNSKYKNEATHYFKNSKYKDVSFEDYRVSIKQEIEKTKISVSELNALSLTARNTICSTMKFHNGFITIDDNSFYFDENLVKLDLYNYKVINVYRFRSNNLAKEYSENGIDHTSQKHYASISIVPNDIEAFETVVDSIAMIYGNNPTPPKFMTTEQEAYSDAAFKKYPFLEEAIKKLGFEGIRKLKFIQTNIKRHLINTFAVNEYTKIYKMLKINRAVESGKWVSNDELVELFTKAYETLGIDKKAKPNDITDYYEAKTKVKFINGVSVRGYLLYTPKFIIK